MVPSPPPPASGGAVYTKIGATSFSSLEYASAKPGSSEHDATNGNRLRAFCAGSKGRALVCIAVTILAAGALLALLFTLRHDHHKLQHSPEPVSPTPPSPSIAPEPASPPVQPPSPSAPSPTLTVSYLCNTTDNAVLCLKTLSTIPSTQSTMLLQDLTAFVSKTALKHLNETYLVALNLTKGGNGTNGEKAVLQDCVELLDQARDGLHDSIDELSGLGLLEDFKIVQQHVMNVRSWLSSSYTDQDTCWEEFQDVNGSVKDEMLESGQLITPLISIALSFAQILQQAGLSSIVIVHPLPP